MTTRRRRYARSAGVRLDLVVLDYLEELAEKEDRDRSSCINRIVREHAERNGRPLPPGTLPPASKPAPVSEER